MTQRHIIARKRRVFDERWGYKHLKGTSQGGAFDLPPAEWIAEELYQFDAKRIDNRAQPPGLTQEIHPIFARKYWPNTSDERYAALHQSMVLATNLINLSGPAFACFFPNFKQNPRRGVRSTVPPDDEHASPSRLQKDQWTAALRMFEEQVLRSVTWWEDPRMLKSLGWLGINMPDNITPPFKVLTHWDWDKADEEAGYLEKRRIRIGLPTVFADIIIANPPGSTRHLLATFYAGVTMMHELGHWCCSHVISPGEPEFGEPYFGDIIEMEMGNAWIAWLFASQMHPDPITLGTKNAPPGELFDHGLYWVPLHKCGDTRTRYLTRYSIPLSHIEYLMSNHTWEGLDLSGYTAPMRRILIGPRPETLGEGAVARMAPAYYELYQTRESDFAQPGSARYINWDHTPLRYADLYLHEKKDQPPRTRSGPPMEFQQLVFKLRALRGGGIADGRRIVRRETDVVQLGDVDSDELETLSDPDIATPSGNQFPRPPPGGNTFPQSQICPGVLKKPHLGRAPTTGRPGPDQNDSNTGKKPSHRTVSHGRVQKPRQERPKSVDLSGPSRTSGAGWMEDDPIRFDFESPNCNNAKSPPIVISPDKNTGTRRKSLGTLNGSPQKTGRSNRTAQRNLSESIPPVQKVPDLHDATHRVSNRQRKTPPPPASNRTRSGNRSERRTGSESSGDEVIGSGTAKNPRRFGKKGKTSNIPYRLNGWRANSAKPSPPRSEKPQTAMVDAMETAQIRTPVWEEFDMRSVRLFYPRTRSQSRGIAQEVERRKSSYSMVSPRMLEVTRKERRESSVAWEQRHGKGRKGWFSLPYDSGNRRRSGGGSGWVDGLNAREVLEEDDEEDD